VPQGYEEDPKLAKWVNTQRTFFKNGKMGQERKRMLYEIGFEGTTNEENWNLQFKKLRDYYGKHDHCEYFGAVDHYFNFILNTPTNTLTCFSQ
jgi:hypothetical protein